MKLFKTTSFLLTQRKYETGMRQLRDVSERLANSCMRRLTKSAGATTYCTATGGLRYTLMWLGFFDPLILVSETVFVFLIHSSNDFIRSSYN